MHANLYKGLTDEAVKREALADTKVGYMLEVRGTVNSGTRKINGTVIIAEELVQRGDLLTLEQN